MSYQTHHSAHMKLLISINACYLIPINISSPWEDAKGEADEWWEEEEERREKEKSQFYPISQKPISRSVVFTAVNSRLYQAAADPELWLSVAPDGLFPHFLKKTFSKRKP